MSISSISSTTNSTSVASGSSDVSRLETQEKSIQSQIQQENSSKDDSKTKEIKVATLQSQLQQIQAQIQQKQSGKTDTKQVQASNNIVSKSNESAKDSSSSNTIDVFA